MVRRTRVNRLVSIAVGGLLVASVLGAAPSGATPSGPSAPSPGAQPKELGYNDAVTLSKARAKGAKTATLLVAAKRGQSDAVAAGLERLGGTIGHRADGIGYLRATLPIDQAAKVARLEGVEAADVDEVVTPGSVRARPQGQGIVQPQSPPGPSTPRSNPYLPSVNTKAAQFVGSHPQDDGRGVTIGVLDTGVDLGSPGVSTTSTGERKIVDWVTYTDSGFTGGVNNDDDPTWVQTTPVDGPSFTAGGEVYTVPDSGSYRFGIFDERDPRLGGEVGNDVNRDGNPPGSSGAFGVLWDPATDEVRVDTDQDRDFTEPAMSPYKVNYDIGTFGTDDPATAIRESMPFVVQTSASDNAVNIGIVSGAQGTHVAGIAAGNNLYGGAADGVAPGAKLVSVRVCLFVSGCTSHALIEGMIYAVRDADVDVVNLSFSGLPALNDANNARAELYNRLIDEYGAQIYVAAGDGGPGLNTVGDPGVSSKVIATGSYIAKTSWLSNYGVRVATDDNLHGFSSRGPREDGGFKPDLVAPGSAVSTIPTWQAGRPIAGTYGLPPGLGMLEGTAMASPQVAGIGAILVGAARSKGRSATPVRIREALLSSARFLPAYGAHEQGAGLAQTTGAVSLLLNKKALRDDAFTAAVPVRTALSGFLATPGVGTGIHDREGVQVGDDYTRTYTLRRTSGPSAPTTYTLRWVGNDGTFSSAGSVSVPLNADVSLPVRIRPSSPGVHSAILQVDDTGVRGVELQTMNTVVAPYDPSATSGSQTVTGTVARGQARSYFFRVPPGAAALRAELSGPDGSPGTGQARFLRFHPWGVGLDDNGSASCYSPPVPGGGCGTGSPLARTVSKPFAGVWEIAVEARRSSDATTTPFTLTVSLLGATVSPDPDVIASATLGQPVSRSYTITNTQAPFTGRAVGTALGSARLQTPTIADGGQQQYQVQVPAGTTSLRATIGSASDPGADLDLFVFRCAPSCALTAQSAGSTAEESVTIPNPSPATYVVLVDAFAVPAGTTTFKYLDLVTNPRFGTISVSDANAVRPAGASWTVSGTVTPTGAPGNERVLYGNVQVRTSDDVLLGQNEVIVSSVS